MQSDRPMRADAARNRAKLLTVAYGAFASEGLEVSIDEIARRAGVGAGTIHRHFPTKDDLYRAVIDDRLQQINAEGQRLLDSGSPEALFEFISLMVSQWAGSKGLVDAFAGRGLDIATISPASEAVFIDTLRELLNQARSAGVVKPELTLTMVKAIIVGMQAMAANAPDETAALIPLLSNALRA